MVRHLLKDSAVYGIGVVLSRLVGFLMIPVYTRVLSPSDYGVIETITRIADVFGLILALGVVGSLLRFYNEATDERDRRALVSTTMILLGIATAGGILALIPMAPWLTRLTFGDVHHEELVRLAMAGMLITSFVQLPLTLFRAQGKPWRFTLISLFQLITALTLNIVLVVHMRMGLLGVVLSGLLTAAVWGAVLTAYMLRSVGIHFERAWAREVLAYGLPFVPSALAQFTLHFSDRFFLVRTAPIDELGLYALAYRFAMLVSVFLGVLANAWWPWAFRVAKEPEGERHLRDGAAFLLTAATCFCAGVILFAGPLIRIVAAEPFWGAEPYVAPLAAAYWFFAAKLPFSLGSHLAKRTGVLAGASTAAAIVCLLLNFWWIPRYHAWGAAASTLASFAILAAFVLCSSHVVRPVRHRLSAAALGLLAIAAASLWSRITAFSFTLDLLLRGLLWIAIGLGLLFWLFRDSSYRIRWNEWRAGAARETSGS